MKYGKHPSRIPTNCDVGKTHLGIRQRDEDISVDEITSAVFEDFEKDVCAVSDAFKDMGPFRFSMLRYRDFLNAFTKWWRWWWWMMIHINLTKIAVFGRILGGSSLWCSELQKEKCGNLIDDRYHNAVKVVEFRQPFLDGNSELPIRYWEQSLKSFFHEEVPGVLNNLFLDTNAMTSFLYQTFTLFVNHQLYNLNKNATVQVFLELFILIWFYKHLFIGIFESM